LGQRRGMFALEHLHARFRRPKMTQASLLGEVEAFTERLQRSRLWLRNAEGITMSPYTLRGGLRSASSGFRQRVERFSARARV